MAPRKYSTYYENTMKGFKASFTERRPPKNWRDLDEFKTGKIICKVRRVAGDPIERAKALIANRGRNK